MPGPGFLSIVSFRFIRQVLPLSWTWRTGANGYSTPHENTASGLVGLKWRETRMLFGKEATAEKWITDAVENECYKTRAESDGIHILIHYEHFREQWRRHAG